MELIYYYHKTPYISNTDFNVAPACFDSKTYAPNSYVISNKIIWQNDYER